MPKTVLLFVALILGLLVLPAYGVELALNRRPCECGRQSRNCHVHSHLARRSA